MTATIDARDRATQASRTALYGVAALTAVSLGGAAVSVSGGLSHDVLDALGPQARLSVPLPMMAFLILTASAAASRRRRVALAGSALTGVATLVALVSGFFDGGYADPRLDTGQRAYQLLLVATLGLVAALAITRFVRVWRSGPTGR
jgi:hypothetical protein